MNWLYFSLFAVAIITFTLALPLLRKNKAGQLFLLIFLGFAAGYFVSEVGYMPSSRPLYGYGFSILIIGGLIYRAIKFYQTIK